MRRRDEKVWANLVSPAADGLGATLKDKTFRVSYHPSHLAD